MNDDIKECKGILYRILQNQTHMMAYLLNSANREQVKKMDPVRMQQLVRANVKRVEEQPSKESIPLMKRKVEQSESIALLKRKANAEKTPLKEVNGKRIRTDERTFAQRKSNEEPRKEMNIESIRTRRSLLNNEHLCEICETGVKVGDLVTHIWCHIKEKLKTDGESVEKNIYRYVCDVSDCKFHTNDVADAKVHYEKHPKVERGKVMVDNTTKADSLFQVALAQCYAEMSHSEKDKIYEMRFQKF